MNKQISAVLLRETDSAYQVIIEGMGKGWVPKSKCSLEKTGSDKGLLTAPQWILDSFGGKEAGKKEDKEVSTEVKACKCGNNTTQIVIDGLEALLKKLKDEQAR